MPDDRNDPDDLDAHLALAPAGERRFSFTVPDGWQQGRGAFGGLVLAALVRAAGAVEAARGGGARALRSLTAELCGPTRPGPADIRIEDLRIGSGVSTLAARLVQGDEVQAHAVLVLGRTRDAGVAWDELAPPALSPWQDTPALPFIPPPMGPAFARFLEFRPVHAPLFSGSDESRTEGWFRLRRPPEVRDDAILALHADAWWPAAYSRLTGFRPMATIAFTFQPLADLAALPPDEPLYHRGRTVAARGGYTVELRELWSARGELLALNQQTMAVIR